jgi:LPXTG-motif cell wall-anchored protein
MKKSFKAITSLVLMLLVVMSMSVTAFAASPSIMFEGFSKGFDFQPGSEYTETDLFGSFKNVMPGDTVTETITFTNSATDCDFVNLYMRAEAHDETDNPLSPKVAEKESVATMTEFLSKLSMKVWNGTELIYDASPDQLDGLKSNKFLGTFHTGETATLKVELSVPIELDNKYANRVGEVDWIFHVEAYNESQLSVRKVWSDGNANHANDSITVNLLKDGKVESSQELNAANGWAYTFDRLLEGHTWTVEEAEVPAGYTVSYNTVGTLTTITNTKKTPPKPDPDPDPSYPLDVVVRKVWSSDDGKDRPDSVTVTLYNGDVPYETVRLGAWNNWTYTWKDLSAYGNWQVIESNIPKGYVPSYSVSGNVVTITNTRSLIQTGQLNWPIWVLGGAGLVLVSLGGAMLVKKKRENNA